PRAHPRRDDRRNPLTNLTGKRLTCSTEICVPKWPQRPRLYPLRTARFRHLALPLSPALLTTLSPSLPTMLAVTSRPRKYGNLSSGCRPLALHPRLPHVTKRSARVVVQHAMLQSPFQRSSLPPAAVTQRADSKPATTAHAPNHACGSSGDLLGFRRARRQLRAAS